MSRRLLAMAFLLLASPAWGQWVTLSYEPQAPAPKVAAPPVETVKAKAGTLAVLQSKATGEVAWVWDRRYLPEVQVYQDTAKKALVLTSGQSVTFLVTCVEHQPTKGFVQVEYLVEFTGGPLPPPGPGPDPIPPPPPNDLAAQMRAAYQSDLKAGKLKPSEYRSVTLIFANAGAFLSLAPDTAGVLLAMKTILDPTVTDGDMPALKAVIAKHMASVSKDNVPLTDELRKKYAAAFGEIARAMEGAEK